MDRRTRGPGAQHDQRRHDLADAVLRIVAHRGLAAVSLNEVATEAGVSSGRVQHYFANKETLIAAAFARGNELSEARIAHRLGAAIDDVPPRFALTVLLTELIPHDAETLAHLRVRQSFTARALSDGAIAAGLRQQYARLHEAVAALLARSAGAAALRPHLDPDDAAIGLVALTEGLAYYVLIEVRSAEAARDHLLREIGALYV
ncbi:TetR/AcrR family transcriptional regulator [Pseudonocardia spinosispora]|uniref:TetR/AcrR family transcriptional regulator n=1 Tax=Pseudonocardia spinosispora TaxID=103441 RepID=UPI00048CADA5|nr:TetR/AcrR family transcriptional regulator [Pseudonocardia spinosispora]